MIHIFFKTIPRSSKPTTFTAAPTGRSSGFCIFGKNPDILKSELSRFMTAQAYGVYFSKPAGGTVINVYVETTP